MNNIIVGIENIIQKEIIYNNNQCEEGVQTSIKIKKEENNINKLFINDKDIKTKKDYLITQQ